MTKYYIFKKSYPNGTPQLISKHGSAANAAEAAEDTAIGSIIALEGHEYLRGKIFHTKSRSGSWRGVPLGYFICKTNTLGKYTIYRKRYGYWKYDVVKICSIFITKKTEARAKYINDYREIAYANCRKLINEINSEILGRSSESVE